MSTLRSYQQPAYVDNLLKMVTKFASGSIYEKVLEKRMKNRIGKNRYNNIFENIESPFNEIEFGQPLTEIPGENVTDVLNFIAYNEEKKNITFEITGRKISTGEITKKTIPYVHRWTTIYRKGILKKLYQLEAEYPDCYDDLCMISPTVSQRGKSPESCLLELRENKTRLIEALRDRFGTHDYFCIFEPHETGYPHCHILYMHKLTHSEQIEIKYMWSSYTDPSSKAHFEHGLEFSDVRASSDGEFKSGSVSRIRGYLMKYLVKGLFNQKEYHYNIRGRNVTFNMPMNELLFNALLKKHKIRLWTCSRHLSQIMKWNKDSSDDWECLQIDEVYSDEQKRLYWTKEHGLKPSFIHVWRPFCSWTTEPLTELYEKHGYKIEYDKNTSLWVAYESVCIPVECA